VSRDYHCSAYATFFPLRADHDVAKASGNLAKRPKRVPLSTTDLADNPPDQPVGLYGYWNDLLFAYRVSNQRLQLTADATN